MPEAPEKKMHSEARRRLFCVPLVFLSQDLGVHKSTVYFWAKKLEAEVRHKADAKMTGDARKRGFVSKVDAERISAAVKASTGGDVGWWPGGDEAAAVLGLNLLAFRKRLDRGTIRLQRRWAGGRMRYSPADLEREARRAGVRPRSIPGNRLSSMQLVALVGIGYRNIHRWQQRGLPCGKTQGGRLYFDPPEVVRWLEGNGQNKYAERLRRAQ